MKKDNIKLALFWICSFLVIIFMIAFKSQAADPYDGSLPFKFSYIDDFNSWATYGDLGNNILDSIDNYGLPVNDNDYVLILRDFGFYSNEGSYRIYRAWFDLYPISEFTNSSSNILTQHVNFNVNSNKTSYYFGVHFDYYGGFNPIVFNVNDNPTINNQLFGRSSTTASIEGNNYSITPYVPFYFSKNFYYDSTLILDSGGPSPIEVGTAIIPPDAINPVYSSGITPPSQVPPTYTSTDYTWTTPPTFDSSSIEAAIGSIQNTLGWIANNLKEEFKNLTNNLKGFFKYIGDTIQYYGNAIIQTLNNFIQNFYDNMKSLVEPIFQKLDYITTPLEADVIWDNISGTSLVSNYTSVINAAVDLKTSFDNLSEPNEFKIPIHLENISMFGNLTTQYIDIGVINPVKSIIRTFMWAMITYSLVVTIIDSIANYINGGGDES